MRQRIIRAVQRLVRPRPRRRPCGLERRRIIAMIDAGQSYATIMRQHGCTRADVDQAIQAHTGRVTDV